MAVPTALKKSKRPKQTVAFLLAPMFEDVEFRIPYDRLRSAGYPIEIIGATAGEELNGVKGKEKVKADKAIGEVKPQDYSALVIPGGFSPDKLRADPRFVQFVKDFDAQQRPVAAICHGPQLLEAAHLVQGRTMTAWQTVQDDLRQMGAEVRDEAVVTDGNWITSRKPEDGEQFSAAILDALQREATAPTVQVDREPKASFERFSNLLPKKADGPSPAQSTRAGAGVAARNFGR
jgi:protease I